MPRITYLSTGYYCGNCKQKLLFMHRKWFIPGAWYVHAKTLKFHCLNDWWSLNRKNTNSKPLLRKDDL